MQDNVKSLIDTRLRRIWAVVDVAREFEHDDGYRGEKGCLEIDSEKKKIKNERKRKKYELTIITMDEKSSITDSNS